MKVNAVSLNQTRYFNIRDEDKPYIKEIRATYCYDPELGVHLCELTPSHELRYLHTYIVWEDDDILDHDDLRDSLEERYCHEGDDDTYMHVSDVRQFAKDHPEYHKVYDCEYESIEEACEQLNGNWPF
jgi:hypothetical protein